FIIPIDITNVSHGMYFWSSDGSFVNGLPIRMAYYSLYFIMLLIVFTLAPFSYFFYEAGDSEIPLRSRIFSAMKYTVFSLLCMFILVAAALVISFFNTSITEKGSVDIKSVLVDENYGVNTISFMLGCLACVGLFPFLIFTGC